MSWQGFLEALLTSIKDKPFRWMAYTGLVLMVLTMLVNCPDWTTRIFIVGLIMSVAGAIEWIISDD